MVCLAAAAALMPPKRQNPQATNLAGSTRGADFVTCRITAVSRIPGTGWL
jgi:hypothetical protein